MALEPTRQKQTSEVFTAQAATGLGTDRPQYVVKGSRALQIIHVGMALLIGRVEKPVCSLPRGDPEPSIKRCVAVFSSAGASSHDMLSTSTKIQKSIFRASRHDQKTVPGA